MFEFIPFIAIGYFIYFFKQNHLNNILTGLIFVSYLFFSTNYTDYGLEFNIFRYLHRAIGTLAAIALVVHIYRYKVNIFRERVVVILTLFFLVILLSFLGNDIYLEHYIHYVRNFIFVSSVAIYLFFALDSNDKLEELFKLIVAITMLLAVFVMVEALNKSWDFSSGPFSLLAGPTDRVTLFYSNPNYLAYALMPGLILTIFSKQKYKQLIVPIIIVSIFCTDSRAAMVGVMFVILVFLFSNFRQLNRTYLIVSLLIITSTSILFFNKIVINHVVDNVRFGLAKITLKIFNEHPINGIGYGQFRTHYYQYIDINSSKNFERSYKPILRHFPDVVTKGVIDDLHYKFKSLHSEIRDGLISHNNFLTAEQLKYYGISKNMELMTHNDLLTVIAELGLLGLVCVIFFIYKLYVELKKLLLHSRINYFLSISLIGSSLIFSLFHNHLNSYMFWFILIVPFIMNRNYQKIN